MIEQIQIERGIPLPRRLAMPNACAFCGQRDRAEGYKTCDECRANVKRQRRERMAQGLCEYFGCPDKPKNGHTSCQVHLDKMLAYSNARRAKRQEAKLCIDCGKRPAWWTLHCVLCRPAGKNILPAGARSAIKRYRRVEAIDVRRAQAEHAVTVVVDVRARTVLVMRHGLTDGVDRTLEEIGHHLDVTRERVRQIELKTLNRLASQGVNVELLRPPFAQLQRLPAITRRHLTSDSIRKHQRAHALVAKALEAGTLVKEPCEKCGASGAIAHHDDYNKPLSVRWLCRVHHMEAHGRAKKQPLPKAIRAKMNYGEAQRGVPHESSWLKRIVPSGELYDAPAIHAALEVAGVKQFEVATATGLNSSTVKKIVQGKNTSIETLNTILRYVETLKQEAA